MPEWVEATAAMLAAVVSVAALIVTGLARRDSRRAAASSDVSAKSAADSAALAQREEARRVERVDVAWTRVEHKPNEHHLIEYQNAGSTSAFIVSAVFTVNGQRVHVECDEVAPGAAICYDASGMGRQVVIAASRGPSGTRTAHGTRYYVSARITWESELGTPGVWVDGVA